MNHILRKFWPKAISTKHTTPILWPFDIKIDLKALLSCAIIFVLIHDVSSQEVQFEDRTSLIRYVTGTLGQAKCGVDMNGDGLDDITRIAKNGIHIDFQHKSGSFSHEIFPMDIQVLPVWSISAGDINNDGLNDLLFGGLTNVSYLISDIINHSFQEVRLDNYVVAQRSNFIDINNDGYIDAFVCHDAGQSKVLRNINGTTLIEDNSLVPTSDLPGNYSSIWMDYNLDGTPDLYVSKCLPNVSANHPARVNLLYKNVGGQQFVEVGAQAGVNDHAQSWTTVAEDFDHDGDFDMFVVNHDEKNRMFKNNGDGTFTDIIDLTGIDPLDLGAFEAVGGDFNNDGHMDIISELNDKLYLGNGDLTFTGQPLSFSPGAIGDFNNDGFLDVTEQSNLWINKGNDNHYVKLILKGWESNCAGIGARVMIESASGHQFRELRSGESYSPMNSLSLHFGIGKDTLINKLEIHWPSGIMTSLSDLRPDSTYIIAEGRCTLPSLSIEVKGNAFWCPGEQKILSVADSFSAYRWNQGGILPEIQTERAGMFEVMYRDNQGCTGISYPLFLLNPDEEKISILWEEGRTQFCDGEVVALTTNRESNVFWTENQIFEDTIYARQSGLYFAALPKKCGTGYIYSDSVYLEFISMNPPDNMQILKISPDSIVLSVDGENCLWFKNENDTTPVGYGCQIVVDSTYLNSNLYVASSQTLLSPAGVAGKTDTSGFYIQTQSSKSMVFTLQKPIKLLSVDMYLSSESEEGQRQVFLLNATNDTILSRSVDLVKGKNTAVLNFDILPGRYQLASDLNGQKVNIGPWDYPYPILHAGKIDSSSSGRNFYPFFYSWSVIEKWDTCYSEKYSFFIDNTGISTFSNSNAPLLSPNPANDLIVIQFNNQIEVPCLGVIYSLEGNAIEKISVDKNGEMRLDVSRFPQGYYQISWLCHKSVFSSYFLVIH